MKTSLQEPQATRGGSRLKALTNRVAQFPPIRKATSHETWQRGKDYLDRSPRVRKWLVTLIILLVVWKVATAVADYLTRPRIDMTMSPLAGSVAVSVIPAERRAIARTVTYTASVQPVVEARIHPRIQGWVQQFLVDAGARVQAGQALVVLDKEEIEGAYLQAQAHHAYLAREFERAEKLLAGGGISQSEFDQTRMMYDEARGRVQAAKARLDYTTLTAPFAGVVTERVQTAIVGTLVGPGQQLLTVADLSRVRVQAKVAESDLPHIRLGTEATVRFPSLPNPGNLVQARVSTVFPGLDPVTRTATVEMVVGNPRGLIRPEMYAVVHLVLETRPDAIVVPRAAVLDLEGSPTVFVTDGVTATARPIKVGIAAGDEVEILEGVNQGELVVQKGNRGLVDGQLVKLVEF
ncbi:MAG: efflux RND transporter periplasmic adaptor subunit [Gemmatimonadetes bacterium]|nr:efflux RND transporter periplasmic adaptor subunit [Gemmatimonadota bacterium]